MKEFEEKVREHCNIEFNKANGDEMINTSLNSLMIAFEEWQSKSNRSVGYTVLLEYLEKCETNKFFFVETDEDECVSLESFYIIDSEYDANKICEQLNKILLGMKNALSKKTE